MKRKNLLIATIVFLGLACLMTVPIFAAEPVVTSVVTVDPGSLDPNTNLPGIAGFLISAFQGKKWFAVGAIILILATWAIGYYTKLKNTDWFPVINAGLGMLAALAVEFLKPIYDWTNVINGLLASGPAALFWSLLFKRILPKSEALKGDKTPVSVNG